MKIIYEPGGRAKEYSDLAANLYTGCLHGCQYCYAPGCLRKNRQEFHATAQPKKDVLHWLEKDLHSLTKHDMFDAQPELPRVLLCFTSDPYQGDDSLNITTRKALTLFRQYNVPFQILTKGGLKAVRDFDLYTGQDAFATTLSFANATDSLKIEPQASLPNDRIKALYEAKQQGITTWVSFEPVLDAEEVYKLFDRTKNFVDLYKVGKCSGNYSNVTDWKTFGNTMIEKMEKAEKAYYIKDDLKKCL